MYNIGMDRYSIALGKKPPPKLDAVQRAAELMKMPLCDLPPIALGYILHKSQMYGSSGEVTLTSLAHYVQVTENLKSSDKNYRIDKKGLNWFKNPFPASYRECPDCKKTVLMMEHQRNCSSCELPF
jgi:hypothetical protein